MSFPSSNCWYLCTLILIDCILTLYIVHCTLYIDRKGEAEIGWTGWSPPGASVGCIRAIHGDSSGPQLAAHRQADAPAGGSQDARTTPLAHSTFTQTEWWLPGRPHTQWGRGGNGMRTSGWAKFATASRIVLLVSSYIISVGLSAGKLCDGHNFENFYCYRLNRIFIWSNFFRYCMNLDNRITKGIDLGNT